MATIAANVRFGGGVRPSRLIDVRRRGCPGATRFLFIQPSRSRIDGPVCWGVISTIERTGRDDVNLARLSSTQAMALRKQRLSRAIAND